MLLWDFAHEMWDHRNSVLHDTKLEASRAMHDAVFNNAITKLYEKVNTYSTEDRWYFEVPLTIRLRKLLRSGRRWLVNARILANKSADRATIGQTTLNQNFTHLLSIRTVQNASLERIGSVQEYVQMNLLNLVGARMRVQDENFKSLAFIRYLSTLSPLVQATKLLFLPKDVV
jgi:hypothetical protein